MTGFLTLFTLNVNSKKLEYNYDNIDVTIDNMYISL